MKHLETGHFLKDRRFTRGVPKFQLRSDEQKSLQIKEVSMRAENKLTELTNVTELAQLNELSK